MKDFFEALKDAFPVLKNHPVATARLLVVLLVLVAVYSARGLRNRICHPLSSKLFFRIFTTSRWLYVYQDSQAVNDWKYYTSESTGNGDTGDDIVWTLVSWPNLKPKDSFRLSGVVGMVEAIQESRAKLLGRWNIVHDPDRPPIGPVPARGLRSKLRRASAKALQALGSI
ncbi:MAG TPA: hypothetical protein VG206_12235 [Terriglobia bacterium]|nr:hypothetical protein [Terriglobia bacterium]